MIEIYDCTLREGEQAEGASFSSEDRIKLCELLDNFGVDFIELGWPLASQEIADCFKKAIEFVKKAKIVAFGSTSIKENPEDDKNLSSIVECGAKYACIFGKTSLEHIEKQLKLTKEENLNKIIDSIAFLKKKGISVFYDAEHYFDAYKENKEYAIRTLTAAIEGGAERLILCDTKGGVLPAEAFEIVKNTYKELKEKGFNVKLGIHFHDDCGLALSNSLACLPYITQVQGTINGIGERIGNLNFSEFIPIYIKKLGNKLDIDLRKLKKINEDAFRIAGISIPEKRAFVGDLAFAHKAGVHIDANSKGVSYEHEKPEDFGNKRVIILNSLGGRSSVISLAKNFGYELDKNDIVVKEKIQELFEKLKEHEKKGYRLGSSKAEQFLLIEKYFGDSNKVFKVNEWEIKSEMRNNEEFSYFRVDCNLDGKIVEGELEVRGGPVDAAFKTLKKILLKQNPNIENLSLVDFHVSIALRHGEESAVRTEIFFSDGEKFSTIGVDKNILGSAIEALEKGFRYYLMRSDDRKNE